MFEYLVAIERDDFVTNTTILEDLALLIIYNQFELDQYVNNRKRFKTLNTILILLIYSRMILLGYKLSAYSN